MSAASSLGDEIKRLFPLGTDPTDSSQRRVWSQSPILPADVFAAAAHLLEASGAYQFLVAPFVGGAQNPGVQYKSSPTRAALQGEIKQWCETGRRWARDPFVKFFEVQYYWSELWKRRNSKFVVRLRETDSPPEWWKIAHALLVIADEASGGIGYTTSTARFYVRSDGSRSRYTRYFWANAFAYVSLSQQNIPRAQGVDPAIIKSKNYPGDLRHRRSHVSVDSLDNGSLDRAVARVLPKGRTTELGCTVRTLSHNLTLSLPRGFTDAYWHQVVSDESPLKTGELNLLLIPYPYQIPAGAFRGAVNQAKNGSSRWGRFKIEQLWLSPKSILPPGDSRTSADLRTSFVDFVKCLLEKAKSQGKTINGVVLPEYALDWETYDAVVRHIREKWPAVEFMISGVSRDCNDVSGNYVVVSSFYPDPKTGDPIATTHSRRKHHRWRLDRGQISAYGLEKDLDPRATWWEYLEVGQRVVHMDVFRNQSALTAVICEDLARVDPALSLIRSLGPNLVFALLMDGPQIADRWSASYANSLSDDPGSSVLTLTSLALIDRSNKTRQAEGLKPGPRSIALWRHQTMGATKSQSKKSRQSLVLKKGCSAIILELSSSPAPETTIDGRPNSDTTAWYFKNSLQVKIPVGEIKKSEWQWILGNA